MIADTQTFPFASPGTSHWWTPWSGLLLAVAALVTAVLMPAGVLAWSAGGLALVAFAGAIVAWQANRAGAADTQRGLMLDTTGVSWLGQTDSPPPARIPYSAIRALKTQVDRRRIELVIEHEDGVATVTAADLGSEANLDRLFEALSARMQHVADEE